MGIYAAALPFQKGIMIIKVLLTSTIIIPWCGLTIALFLGVVGF